MPDVVDTANQPIHQHPTVMDTASRTLLETFVAEAYRNGRLTVDQVRKLLSFGTRMQASTFLLSHSIYDYSTDDFEKDMANLDSLFPPKHALPLE